MTNFVLDEPAIRNCVLPMTSEQYRFMGESGLLENNVELIRGFIVKKMPKPPLHTLLVKRLQGALVGLLPTNYFVRKEEPLALQNSEPEPDLALAIGSAEQYAQNHPSGAETLLVCEVALSSLALDRKKAELYAEADIPHYWLVNGVEMRLEAYSTPEQGVYTHCTILAFNESITVPFAAGNALHLSTIFPHPAE